MTKQVAKQEESLSLRFTNAVIQEFTSGTGEVALTDFQKRLAQNYFMAIDVALRGAEERRQKQSENRRDNVPVTWANVNMQALAQDVVSLARIGLDPMMDNHVSPVPYKNNRTGKYDIGFIEGYRGLELKARKYGLDVPDQVVVELVYSNDVFKPIKKDRNNTVETYEFEVTDPFNRGDVIGGFYYHMYLDIPEKNKLVVFNLKDILKRKPRYASVEFWGGEKDVWENGKRTGEKEQVDGWFEEMAWKTIYRAAYRDITIDSQKIDDDYMRLKQIETDYTEARAQQEVDLNANSEVLDIEVDYVEDAEFEEVPAKEQPKKKTKAKSKTKKEPEPEKESQQETLEPEWADDEPPF